MEDQFDRPMSFDPALISDPAVAGQGTGAWGQGVVVYGAAKGYKRPRTMPTLMSNMFGFECEEEMDDEKKYLLLHGGYQLETGELADAQSFQCILQSNDALFSCIIDLPMRTIS